MQRSILLSVVGPLALLVFTACGEQVEEPAVADPPAAPAPAPRQSGDPESSRRLETVRGALEGGIDVDRTDGRAARSVRVAAQR
jgi:hypothetical protein